ncbi:MAG: DUF1269 domain-containing protein [Acidimicrobiia bacterium]|nr:DUF1269 domain-containing protein [Acidimicrobiia bacterium]
MSDSNTKVEVVAAVYPNLYDAQVAFNDLVELHNSGAIELLDAAVLVRERSGNLTITERAELTPAQGATRGALIGAVLGIVFPPSLLAGAAVGAVAGAMAGKATDQGFANEMLEELAQKLDPGKSAILAAAEHTLYERVAEAVSGSEHILSRTCWADENGHIQL